MADTFTGSLDGAVEWVAALPKPPRAVLQRRRGRSSAQHPGPSFDDLSPHSQRPKVVTPSKPR
jgi:hypothetical protein